MYVIAVDTYGIAMTDQDEISSHWQLAFKKPCERTDDYGSTLRASGYNGLLLDRAWPT